MLSFAAVPMAFHDASSDSIAEKGQLGESPSDTPCAPIVSGGDEALDR